MEDKKGISGSTLKLIAMISMLIDHTAASVLLRILVTDPANFDVLGKMQMTPICIIYMIMRGIGRLAFPIYIFLLLEGFEYTRNRWRYLGRLALFALVSEIPFDMAFMMSNEDIHEGHIVEFTYQNVFWTLALGLLTITIIDKIGTLNIEPVGRFWIQFMVAVFGMGLAYVLKTDYDAVGVLAIVVAYVLRRNRTRQMAGICVSLVFAGLMEEIALIDILPVAYYNGKRGINLKWLFYAFYPVHLLILALICIAMGI